MAVNIERFLQEQIREQKKASSGAFHKRGKGVKHGSNKALLTPYYFMTNKEKKKLNGEVQISFMYETIIHKNEFLLKPKDLQVAMLTRWREIYSNGQIKDQMGMYNKEYYDLVDALKLPKKARGGARDNTGNRKGKVATKPVSKPKDIKEMALQVQESIMPAQPKEEVPQVKPILITNGLHLEYNGEYTAEQITKIFTKLQLITDGEENKFHLAISLTERT